MHDERTEQQPPEAEAQSTTAGLGADTREETREPAELDQCPPCPANTPVTPTLSLLPPPTPTPTPAPTPLSAPTGLPSYRVPPHPALRERMERLQERLAKKAEQYAADIGKYEQQSDSGNAEEMAVRYRDRLRFVPAWGWLTYAHGVWQRAERDSGNVAAARLAKETLRQLVKEAADIDGDNERRDQLRHLQHSFNRILPMVETAKSCLALFAEVADFDRHPLLLNLRNGVYDLEHDQFVPHAPTFLLTKQAPVSYDPQATAPTWERVVDDIFNHDADLIAYFQRGLGYSLTADVREDAFFVCFGTGANGKSTLLNAVMAVLGDYAQPLKADVLMTQATGNSGSASPELAKLVGARFVTAQEPRRGSLDTSRVKELTGRDPMQVRELYREPFTLVPSFKLWLSTNERPDVPEQTVGIWRRIRLIPFTRSFASAPDTSLPAKLYEERSGILNWLLEGVRLWRRDGLGAAKAVSEATHDYQAQNDPYLDFFTDWLVPDHEHGGSVKMHDAYTAFKAWRTEALTHGGGPIEFLGDRVFGKTAEAHGYAKHKGTGGVPYLYECRLTTESERGERALACEAKAEAGAASGAGGESGESGESGDNQPLPETFPRENSHGKSSGNGPDISTTSTEAQARAPDPDPSTLSRSDLIAAVASQLAPAARSASASDPTTCRHARVQAPTSDRATWQCRDCGREWPTDACPLLTETYWHAQFTPPTDPNPDANPDAERRDQCRHLRAYPPQQADYDPGDPPVWKCPDCPYGGHDDRNHCNGIVCAHPAEHHPAMWRHGGCIACAIEDARHWTAPAAERAEQANADPPLWKQVEDTRRTRLLESAESGWARALAYVPVCPNSAHSTQDHAGFRCCRSHLPLAYERWDLLRRQPFDLIYEHGQPVDVKRTLSLMDAMWQDEAVAGYLINVLGVMPAEGTVLRKKWERVTAFYDVEVKKLTCPHPHAVTELGVYGPHTTCPDCGACLEADLPAAA